jgi:hypothetical protein
MKASFPRFSPTLHCFPAARAWNRGMDTKEIAAELMLFEAQVYNNLDLIRTVAARLREGKGV